MGDSPPLAQRHALPVREISPGEGGFWGSARPNVYAACFIGVCIKFWSVSFVWTLDVINRVACLFCIGALFLCQARRKGFR